MPLGQGGLWGPVCDGSPTGPPPAGQPDYGRGSRLSRQFDSGGPCSATLRHLRAARAKRVPAGWIRDKGSRLSHQFDGCGSCSTALRYLCAAQVQWAAGRRRGEPVCTGPWEARRLDGRSTAEAHAPPRSNTCLLVGCSAVRCQADDPRSTRTLSRATGPPAHEHRGAVVAELTAAPSMPTTMGPPGPRPADGRANRRRTRSRPPPGCRRHRLWLVVGCTARNGQRLGLV